MNKTYKISTKIVWKDADDTVYILQPERDEVHILNETGSFIWRLIAKKKSYKQIQTALLDHFEVDESTAQKDVKDFLARYVRDGFLVG